MVQYKVEVTQEDINRGVRGECQNCPVALAVSRATGQPATVTVSHIRVGRLQGVCSREIYGFIDAFDNGRPVAPFSFDLEVPNEAA